MVPIAIVSGTSGTFGTSGSGLLDMEAVTESVVAASLGDIDELDLVTAAIPGIVDTLGPYVTSPSEL